MSKREKQVVNRCSIVNKIICDTVWFLAIYDIWHACGVNLFAIIFGVTAIFMLFSFYERFVHNLIDNIIHQFHKK
ncbi:hypothetical protein B1R32_105122 [Abditibacterium utsteinense]|uniref:Uncharacterized protein n=1 Tax=Abditibacterium utsteinense TaxID=1960156 RepID=A0A2S8SUG7_9BACT|nr:hypothetical protein B1R32_105122 [Abditibacterium utsteinense]